MWTDFDEPSHTIVGETATARERARSKRRRKQPPRSKCKSNGAPRAVSNKLTLGKPTSCMVSTQTDASAMNVDLTTPDLKAVHKEQLKAPQAATPHVASNINALGSQAAQSCPSRIKYDETAEVVTFAVQTEDATIMNDDEIGGGPANTSAASVLYAIELQSPERRPYHGAFRKSSLAGMGLVSLFSVLWLLNPASHPEAEAPGTNDQAPVSSRVWTDPPLMEQVRSAAEISPIATQPKEQVAAALMELVVVQKAPSQVSPRTDLPVDNRLVEATSGPLVHVLQEVVQSASVASVPLPPRRPVSLIVRHMPVAHPLATTTTVTAIAPTESSVGRAEPPEAYASFSARKHEIGTHKLPWGMARLHEDPNSDSSRGVVWDFVPSEP